VLRALARLELADLYGASRIPIYVLNVAYPLVPEELREFCAGKRAVLVVEEGIPTTSSRRSTPSCAAPISRPACSARGRCRTRANTRPSCCCRGLHPSRRDAAARRRRRRDRSAHAGDAGAQAAATAAAGDIPARPPNFCTGCPERPVFTPSS
jgi:indolepyruvate ferredoxin oxidoreductase alpha subunit